MIVADLERANGRVAAVERRNVRFFSPSDIVSTYRCLDCRRSFGQRSRESRADPSTSTGEPASCHTPGPLSPLNLSQSSPLSVKALESQISELESEASRLLKGLDSEKESKRKLERDLSKRIEDLTKDVAARVRLPSRPRPGDLELMPVSVPIRRVRSRASESAQSSTATTTTSSENSRS